MVSPWLDFAERYLRSCSQDICIISLDATGNSSQWVFLYAAKFEKEQLRIQEELDRVVGRDRMPTLADRKNLPYTEAFLYESMRHGVGGPFGKCGINTFPPNFVRQTYIGKFYKSM